ncbi:MAG: hypothetical protein KDA61_23150, partial [Planctomycetales bacterium]|nr:hypothetical protein [Planctomycetales bacterium]
RDSPLSTLFIEEPEMVTSARDEYRVSNSAELVPPSQPGRPTGDFVHAHQTMASDMDFPHVSKAWFQKTQAIDEAIEELSSSQKAHEATTHKLSDLQIIDGDGLLYVDDRSGRRYRPTELAMRQLGALCGVGGTYPASVLARNDPDETRALSTAFAAACANLPAEKYVTLKSNKNSLRGIVDAAANVLRNTVLLDVLRRTFPESRVSHRRGDDYTVMTNILVPESIRAEHDSEYGAMISLVNCELTSMQTMLRPSIFRAICRNGCIWGKTEGKKWTYSRRCSTPWFEAEKDLVDHLREQIPVAIAGLDALLATRTLTTDVSAKPLIAQVSLEAKLSKRVSTAVLEAWHVEKEILGDKPSLFAVANALTRAGQTLDERTWLRLDELAGQLVADNEAWESIVRAAAKLSARDVDRRFAAWNAAA